MDPRSFLKSVGKKQLIPSDNYWLAIDRSPLRFTQNGLVHSKTSEWVPMRVERDGGFSQLDGEYGLIDDVYKHFGLSGSPSTAEEDMAGEAVTAYMAEMHKALKAQQVQGVVNGVVGPRYWALIYYNETTMRLSGMTGGRLAEYGVNPSYLKWIE